MLFADSGTTDLCGPLFQLGHNSLVHKITVVSPSVLWGAGDEIAMWRRTFFFSSVRKFFFCSSLLRTCTNNFFVSTRSASCSIRVWLLFGGFCVLCLCTLCTFVHWCCFLFGGVFLCVWTHVNEFVVVLFCFGGIFCVLSLGLCESFLGEGATFCIVHKKINIWVRFWCFYQFWFLDLPCGVQRVILFNIHL